MSQPILHILGTASQVPTRHRNHNGYFLAWGREGFLFDPGEGIQRQMILSGISASKITKIMITHFHGDHCLGLAGIIQRLSLDQASHRVDIWFPESGLVFFERLRAASIFHDRTDLAVHPISAPGVIYQDSTFTIEAQALDHGVETYGYRIIEKDGVTMSPEALARLGISGPDVGKLIREGALEHGGGKVQLAQVSRRRPGRSMAFVMDTRPCDGALQLARNTDLLVCEATYLQTEAREAHEHYHMTATQAGRLATEADARKLVLTHFSQRYPEIDGFLEEAGCHPLVIAARDGDQISFPERPGPGEDAT